jgi:hypothetical protein
VGNLEGLKMVIGYNYLLLGIYCFSLIVFESMNCGSFTVIFFSILMFLSIEVGGDKRAFSEKEQEKVLRKMFK